ncbi:MAG: antitoxin family protein [Pyrinomonadaceae bacterium]
MSEAVEAIFENGVFRPLRPINLEEGERVQPTVTSADNRGDDPAADFSDIAVDMEIPDLATNIDYYLYGLPKQSDTEPES